jgi:hypothetical protein
VLNGEATTPEAGELAILQEATQAGSGGGAQRATKRLCTASLSVQPGLIAEGLGGHSR